MSEPERVGFQPITVYRVPKACKRCPATWEGNSFSPAPSDGSPVMYVCDKCIAKEEAERRALTQPERDSVELVEPTAPRRVFGYDD